MAAQRASTKRVAAFRKSTSIFYEGLLNRVEVQGIRRQVKQRGVSGLNGLLYTHPFMDAWIVHHHDIPGASVGANICSR